MTFYDFGLKEEQEENPGRVNQNYNQEFLAIPGVLHDLNLLCIWESRMEIAVKKCCIPPPPMKICCITIKKQILKCCRLFLLGSQGFKKSSSIKLMQLVARLQKAQPLSC